VIAERFWRRGDFAWAINQFCTLPRSRLCQWLEQKWPRQKITREWLQTEEDHARRREQILQELAQKTEETGKGSVRRSPGQERRIERDMSRRSAPGLGSAAHMVSGGSTVSELGAHLAMVRVGPPRRPRSIGAHSA
jgi:hypothetical protein